MAELRQAANMTMEEWRAASRSCDDGDDRRAANPMMAEWSAACRKPGDGG